MITSGTNRAPKHLKVYEWMITSGTNRAETLKGA